MSPCANIVTFTELLSVHCVVSHFIHGTAERMRRTAIKSSNQIQCNLIKCWVIWSTLGWAGNNYIAEHCEDAWTCSERVDLGSQVGWWHSSAAYHGWNASHFHFVTEQTIKVKALTHPSKFQFISPAAKKNGYTLLHAVYNGWHLVKKWVSRVLFWFEYVWFQLKGFRDGLQTHRLWYWPSTCTKQQCFPEGNIE